MKEWTRGRSTFDSRGKRSAVGREGLDGEWGPTDVQVLGGPASDTWAKGWWLPPCVVPSGRTGDYSCVFTDRSSTGARDRQLDESRRGALSESLAGGSDSSQPAASMTV